MNKQTVGPALMIAVIHLIRDRGSGKAKGEGMGGRVGTVLSRYLIGGQIKMSNIKHTGGGLGLKEGYVIPISY